MDALITETLRRQHMELFELGSALRERLVPEIVARETVEVRRELARFLGKVRVHAAMENQALYPGLMADDDPHVRAVAMRLFEDVGPIYQVVQAVGEQYPTSEAVAADVAGFTRAARQALRVLGERVMRETTELYPLVDARAGR